MTMQRTIVMGFRFLLLMMNSGLVMTDVIAMNFLSKQQFDGDHNKKNRLYIHIEERTTENAITLTNGLIRAIRSKASLVICSADSLCDGLERYKSFLLPVLAADWDIISLHNSNLVLLIPHELKYYKLYDGKQAVDIPRIMPGAFDIQWDKSKSSPDVAGDIIRWLYRQKFKGNRNDEEAKQHNYKTGIAWSDIQHLFTLYTHDFTVVAGYDQELKDYAAQQKKDNPVLPKKGQKESGWDSVKNFFAPFLSQPSSIAPTVINQEHLLADYLENPVCYEQQIVDVIVREQQKRQPGLKREYFQKRILGLLRGLKMLAQDIRQQNKQLTAAEVFRVIQLALEQEFFIQNKWNIFMAGHGFEEDNPQESRILGMPAEQGVKFLRDLQALPIYVASLQSCFLGGKNKQMLLKPLSESDEKKTAVASYNYHMIILSGTDTFAWLFLDSDIQAYFSLLEYQHQIDFSYLNYFLSAPAPYYLLSNHPKILYAGTTSFKTLNLPKNSPTQLSGFIQKAIDGYAAFTVTDQAVDRARRQGGDALKIIGKSGLLVYPAVVPLPLVIQSQKLSFVLQDDPSMTLQKKIINKLFLYYYTDASDSTALAPVQFYAPFPTMWELSLQNHYAYLFPIVVTMDDQLPLLVLEKIRLSGASAAGLCYSHEASHQLLFTQFIPSVEQISIDERKPSMHNAGVLTFITQAFIATLLQKNKRFVFIKELVGINDFNAILDQLGDEAVEKNRALYELVQKCSGAEIILKNILIITKKIAKSSEPLADPVVICFEYEGKQFECSLDFKITPFALYDPADQRLNWQFRKTEQSLKSILNAHFGNIFLNVGKLTELLQKNSSVNALLDDKTLFELTLHNKDFQAFDWLLERTDQDHIVQYLGLKDAQGMTVLHHSIKQENEAVLRKILDLLEEQAKNKPFEVEQILMAQDDTAKTLFHSAAIRHNSIIFELLFEVIGRISKDLLGRLLATLDDERKSVLYYAHKSDDYNFILMVLEKISGIGAHFLAQQLRTMNTETGPLYDSARPKILKKFLEYGAQVDVECVSQAITAGFTPLYHALERGDYIAVVLLLSYGANLEAMYEDYVGDVHSVRTLQSYAHQQLIANVIMYFDQFKAAYPDSFRHGEERCDAFLDYCAQLALSDELKPSLRLIITEFLKQVDVANRQGEKTVYRAIREGRGSLLAYCLFHMLGMAPEEMTVRSLTDGSINQFMNRSEIKDRYDQAQQERIRELLQSVV